MRQFQCVCAIELCCSLMYYFFTFQMLPLTVSIARCVVFYHYQEQKNGLHNFNDHIILDLPSCLTLPDFERPSPGNFKLDITVYYLYTQDNNIIHVFICLCVFKHILFISGPYCFEQSSRCFFYFFLQDLKSFHQQTQYYMLIYTLKSSQNMSTSIHVVTISLVVIVDLHKKGVFRFSGMCIVIRFTSQLLLYFLMMCFHCQSGICFFIDIKAVVEEGIQYNGVHFRVAAPKGIHVQHMLSSNVRRVTLDITHVSAELKNVYM